MNRETNTLKAENTYMHVVDVNRKSKAPSLDRFPCPIEDDQKH